MFAVSIIVWRNLQARYQGFCWLPYCFIFDKCIILCWIKWIETNVFYMELFMQINSYITRIKKMVVKIVHRKMWNCLLFQELVWEIAPKLDYFGKFKKRGKQIVIWFQEVVWSGNLTGEMGHRSFTGKIENCCWKWSRNFYRSKTTGWIKNPDTFIK